MAKTDPFIHHHQQHPLFCLEQFDAIYQATTAHYVRYDEAYGIKQHNVKKIVSTWHLTL
jgi:hypothetical protein